MNVHVRSQMFDFGLALFVTVLATWLRHLIHPYVGDRVAFVTYFPAVFITAIYTRLGPCLLTIALSTVAAAYYFIPPADALLPEDTAGWTGLALFAFFGVGVGLLSERVRQSERKLRGSEEALADFFENAAMGLHWVGPDGTILRVNRAELDMLGYTREEYVGHHIAEFHADQPVIEDILHCLASGQQLRDYEARLRCKDGTIKHVLIDSNVLWEDGKFIHTRCLTRDISQRRHAQASRQPVELATLVARSVDALRPQIESQEQELVVSLPSRPIWLHADPVRLVQVIENLLNNASKYTDAKGRIELTASCEQEQAVITVKDTGIGIESELLPNVFELFTQSSRSLDRSQGGLGIGLTLVQSLVQMHGGTVSAHSDGLGQGSTFEVRLPLLDQAPAQKESSVVAPEMVQNRRIVVVDDNVSAAWLLSKLLTKLGDHEVVTAHDGHSALETIKAIHPEIVLLDIGLPGMDGYQVGRNIRESSAFDDVLLVALTGYGQPEDRLRSKEAGFDEHLVKPPSLEQLSAVLAHPKLAAK